MQKTILYIASSLDGYIAGKDDDLSWLEPYQDVDYDFQGFYKNIGAIVVGRKTYDIEVKNGWDRVHQAPRIVLSKRVPVAGSTPPDVAFMHDDLSAVLIAARKRAGRKDVWLEGGADVAQQFISQGRVDEIILTLAPVLLGDGIRLFDTMHAQPSLSLQNVRQFDRGLVQLCYTIRKE